MPSRGSYQIANQEERKIAQRDQSFRNCIATLLVFLVLFIIILIVNLSWRKSNTSLSNTKDDDEYSTAHQHGNGQRKLETTTRATTTDILDDIITEENVLKNEQKSGYFGRYSENKTTTKKFLETSTSKTLSNSISTLSDDTSNNEKTSYYNRYSENKTTTQEFLETTTLTTLSDSVNTLNDDIKSTDSQDQTSTIVRKMQSTEQPIRYSDITDTTLFENNETSENKPKNSSTMDSTIMETHESTGKTDQIFTEYPITSTDNESVSNSSLFDPINSTDNTNSITTEPNDITTRVPTTIFLHLNASESFTVTDITENNSTDQFLKTNSTTAAYENTSTGETVTTTESIIPNTFTTSSNTEETVTATKSITLHTFMTSSNTESNVIKNNICNSGHCKQIAARILSYMNHSADPCEDFYEYACGGMIADPQIRDLSLADKAYHRIAKQMLKNDDGDASSLFRKYYNSCMQYENVHINERIRIANEAINKIGKFYMYNEKFEGHGNFTNMYTELLKTYNPSLFDVTVDLDENYPGSYTIRIGPVLHKNLFDSNNIDDFCYLTETETQQSVDLENLYENYTICKQNNTRFIYSISKALQVLGVFNNSDNMQQEVDRTIINIDTEIVQNFFSVFPNETELRKAYLKKSYSKISINELNKTTTFVNWYNLITSLTSSKNIDKKIQIYFYKQMIQGLQNLEVFWKKEPKEFHNAILGLYAHKLYHELIILKHRDMKQHCLKVSVNLLEPEASNLYMSSLSEKEITFMNHTVKLIFDELKKTLQSNIEDQKWVTNEQRQALLFKLNDLKLSVPEVSYFHYEEKYKLNLSDNYLENSLYLMRRYRSSIYSIVSLDINLGTPKQIWTHYATPFQSQGVAIHTLNLIIIPFGAIDYGGIFMSDDENSFNYLTWATIGNKIAIQISHQFDANGMYYWNQIRNINGSLFSENGNTIFEDYLACHEDNYSQTKKNIILPYTSQNIHYKISELTLNERLSEIMGLNLTYNTLKRQKLSSNSYLPWLELNIDQSFYLTYAQMYCTKSLLTTSYISLHENEELPSRVRVFISASNNNLLGKAWNCSEGSQIVPSSTCDIFPYFTLKEEVGYSK